MRKNIQILGSALLFCLMLGMTIYASSYQNLFTEFDFSGSPQWFHATLVDFYINQLILWFWVAAIETKNMAKAFWLILFICFGSMGTTLYIILRLLQKKSLLRKE